MNPTGMQSQKNKDMWHKKGGNKMYKEKKIDVVTLAICLDRITGIANEIYEKFDDTDLTESLNKVVEELKSGFENVKTSRIYFDKVKTVLLKPEDMETVNISTGIDEFSTDNWCDLSEFERVEEDIKNGDSDKTSLKNFVQDTEYEALKNGEIDYIVFRIDC